MPAVVRIGGSHAQRELWEDTLIVAYLRAGHRDKATKMISDRLRRRPSTRDEAWSREARKGAEKAGVRPRKAAPGLVFRTPRRRHEHSQRIAVARRHGQAQFRPPPQDVVRETRPFFCHEVADLGGRQFRPKGRTEFGPVPGVAKYGIKARAIGGDQALGLNLAQKPPALARTIDLIVEPRPGEVAARERPSWRSSAATSDRKG